MHPHAGHREPGHGRLDLPPLRSGSRGHQDHAERARVTPRLTDAGIGVTTAPSPLFQTYGAPRSRSASGLNSGSVVVRAIGSISTWITQMPRRPTATLAASNGASGCLPGTIPSTAVRHVALGRGGGVSRSLPEAPQHQPGHVAGSVMNRPTSSGAVRRGCASTSRLVGGGLELLCRPGCRDGSPSTTVPRPWQRGRGQPVGRRPRPGDPCPGQSRLLDELLDKSFNATLGPARVPVRGLVPAWLQMLKISLIIDRFKRFSHVHGTVTRGR